MVKIAAPSCRRCDTQHGYQGGADTHRDDGVMEPEVRSDIRCVNRTFVLRLQISLVLSEEKSPLYVTSHF